MPIHRKGELELLKEIKGRFSAPPFLGKHPEKVMVGIGDDAAVIFPPRGNLILTTDTMVEGVDFDLSYTSPAHAGFKLVTVNVSDIRAMGGVADYLLLTIALNDAADEGMFDGVCEGVAHGLEYYRVGILGGDLSSTKGDMVLSATIVGAAERVITRAGARPGDKLFVTGMLGDSAAGLALLQRASDETKEKIRRFDFLKNKGESVAITTREGTHIEWNTAKPLLMRHLVPTARDPEPFSAFATAMIDISDGLFIDLTRLCDASAAGARVRSDAIPISRGMKEISSLLKIDPLSLATSGGEDFELLFTVPPERADAVGPYATCIGEILEKERVVVDHTGKESALVPAGYQHFGSS